MYSPLLDYSDREGKRSDSEDPMTLSVLFHLREQQRESSGGKICKIKIFFILNLIVFGAIIASLTLPRWYILMTGNGNTYWGNFLTLQKANSDDDVVYHEMMFIFVKNDCEDGTLTIDDPVGLCNVVTDYTYTGLVSVLLVFVGLLLHLIHIIKLLTFSIKKPEQLISGIGTFRLPYLVSTLYIAAYVYWMLSSFEVLSEKAPGLEILDRIGYSMQIYVLSSLCYLILTFLYKCI
jgi:hypothetical protein